MMPHVSLIDSHMPFAIGDVEVHPYPVPHDAREPAQFVFSDGDLRLGLLTDTGDSTPHIERMLSGLDALILECNHDHRPLDERRLSSDAQASYLQPLRASRQCHRCTHTRRHRLQPASAFHRRTPVRAEQHAGTCKHGCVVGAPLRALLDRHRKPVRRAALARDVVKKPARRPAFLVTLSVISFDRRAWAPRSSEYRCPVWEKPVSAAPVAPACPCPARCCRVCLRLLSARREPVSAPPEEPQCLEQARPAVVLRLSLLSYCRRRGQSPGRRQGGASGS